MGRVSLDTTGAFGVLSSYSSIPNGPRHSVLPDPFSTRVWSLTASGEGGGETGHHPLQGTPKEHRTLRDLLGKSVGDHEAPCRFLRRISVRVSARTILCVTISSMIEGSVDTDVTTEVGGNTISARISPESAKRLGLSIGGHACAVLTASCAIIGVG